MQQHILYSIFYNTSPPTIELEPNTHLPLITYHFISHSFRLLLSYLHIPSTYKLSAVLFSIQHINPMKSNLHPPFSKRRQYPIPQYRNAAFNALQMKWPRFVETGIFSRLLSIRNIYKRKRNKSLSHQVPKKPAPMHNSRTFLLLRSPSSSSCGIP